MPSLVRCSWQAAAICGLLYCFASPAFAQPGGSPFDSPPLPATQQTGQNQHVAPASQGTAGAVDRYGFPITPEPTSNLAAPAATAQGPVPTITDGQIIARVNNEPVLAADVLPAVNEQIQQALSQTQAEVPPAELEKARYQLMQQFLRPVIDRKLVYAEARRMIPAENFTKVAERLDEQFQLNRVPDLYEATGSRSLAELDAKLQEYGSSLDGQKQVYRERALATHWMQQQVSETREVTRDEMLRYYREHIEEFQLETKARWEELLIRPENYLDKATAYAELARLGQQVQNGAVLADVARASSQGVTAQEGGQYDWMTRGSLASTILDDALFTLSVGQLSQIFEDEFGFRIIRVIERTDAGQTPFEEAQSEIRTKILNAEREAQVQEYIAKLYDNARIWTIFDDQPTAQIGAGPQADIR